MSLTGLLFTFAFLAGCLLALARHPIFGVVTYIATFFLSPPLYAELPALADGEHSSTSQP